MLRFDRKQQNSIKQLSFNKKNFFLKKKRKNSFKFICEISQCPVVKNPPSNAGNSGSVADWGTKIPHAVGEVRPCQLLNP